MFEYYYYHPKLLHELYKPNLKPTLKPTRWNSIIQSNIDPSITNLRSGNHVTYLIGGEKTFKEMIKAIRTAVDPTHYIYFLGWLNDDNFNMNTTEPVITLKDLFIKANSYGVQIREMLWDQVGTVNSSKVRFVNSLENGAAILDNETLYFGCHHQKVLIIKGNQGLITFCGGIDINSDRVKENSIFGAPLHDVHCKIIGPSSYDLLKTFIRRWLNHPLSQKIDLQKGKLLGYAEPVPLPFEFPPKTYSVCIARTFNPIHNKQILKKERDIKKLLITSIRNAQSSIYIEDQYLINPDTAVELNRAIPRLKSLVILIAGLISDLPCAQKFRSDFIKIMTCGLSPADISKIGIYVLVTPPHDKKNVYGIGTYVHSKIWTIDDELAVIGSSNINRRGWDYDSEVNAFIFDDENSNNTFAKNFRKSLWSKHLSINVQDSLLNDPNKGSELWNSVAADPNSKVALYNPAQYNRISSYLCDKANAFILDPTIEEYTNFSQFKSIDIKNCK